MTYTQQVNGNKKAKSETETHLKNTQMFEIEKLMGICTLQDLGREKAQHLGFSSGGAADEHAFSIAQYLIGNPINSPAFELQFCQLSIRCNQAFNFAISGADCNAKINDKPIDNWQSHQLYPNDILSLSLPTKGLISYLAFDFPLATKYFLGSCSQTTNEKSLGLFAPEITEGDSFHAQLRETSKSKASINKAAQPFHSKKKEQIKGNANSPDFCPQRFYGQVINKREDARETLVLRFIPSDQYLRLSSKEKAQFLEKTYSVSSQSNRMGYRLNADAPLTLSQKSEAMLNQNKLSKPVCFGAIQLPTDKNPIVLMKDRQTIGGYPLLGNVMQTDLFRLAQKRPGEHVRFAPTTTLFAQQQLISFHNKWR